MMKAVITFLFLLATHSFATELGNPMWKVTNVTVIDGRPGPGSANGYGAYTQGTGGKPVTTKIHPQLLYNWPDQDGDVMVQFTDNGGRHLMYFTTSKTLKGSVDDFLLSVNLGTRLHVSTKPLRNAKPGSLILETSPLYNNNGMEIGRQWSGCVPGQGPLTIYDELLLTRTSRTSDFIDTYYAFRQTPSLENFPFQQWFVQDANLDGNYLRYYNLNTREERKEVSRKQNFTENESVTFIPIECGCPEAPSCLFRLPEHGSLLLNSSTTYRVVYKPESRPFYDMVRFRDAIISSPISPISEGKAARHAMSLTLYAITVIACILF